VHSILKLNGVNKLQHWSVTGLIEAAPVFQGVLVLVLKGDLRRHQHVLGLGLGEMRV